ncbi:MAG: ATP-binding protein [Spirochaetaceae bacterium]|jgi:predicted AAA+ superfamily ATPase|nr:ATP-binding protein [Spirochaetaceae bacterium]
MDYINKEEVTIPRPLYTKKIGAFAEKPFIKILSGIRRCGKSSVMRLLAEHFREKGIREEQIIFINFEDYDYAKLLDAPELHRYIKSRLGNYTRYYIFLDEIQEVAGWEKVLNSLLLDSRIDIYITGSNSRLLSSELSTYIAGRYVEFHINPLSFAEYRAFKEHFDESGDFEDYIRTGGFPAIHTAKYSGEERQRIIQDIYSSALLRDVVQRNNIRNIELLDRIVKFVFDNMGNPFSGKRVADYFKSQQRKTDPETVYNYLSALEAAFIIQSVHRYDLRGREILKTNEKYYLGDHSLINALSGSTDKYISGVLENIVFHEAQGRGWTVYTGKIDTQEVDFVLQQGDKKVYIQVAYRLNDNQETIDREFGSLLKIKDQYPKYVITMDDFWKGNIEGVKHYYIADFLLLPNWA